MHLVSDRNLLLGNNHSTVFPPQRGWWTHGRRWAWRWSPTPRRSAPSASSRCTLKWWAIVKSLTSAASATPSQPAHNTVYRRLEMPLTYWTPIPTVIVIECIAIDKFFYALFNIFYVLYAQNKVRDWKLSQCHFSFCLFRWLLNREPLFKRMMHLCKYETVY